MTTSHKVFNRVAALVFCSFAVAMTYVIGSVIWGFITDTDKSFIVVGLLLIPVEIASSVLTLWCLYLVITGGEPI